MHSSTAERAFLSDNTELDDVVFPILEERKRCGRVYGPLPLLLVNKVILHSFDDAEADAA